MRPLEILVAAPTRVGRTKVGLNLAQALGALGHRVRHFDYDARPWHLRWLPKPLRGRHAAQAQADYANAALLDSVRAAPPDLFLCVKGVQFTPETLRAVRAAGAVTAGYWIDDPLDHARSLINAAAYDHYFTNDRSSLERYAAAGLPRVVHLPSSADSTLFFPQPEAEPLADLIFIGTHSPYRENILRQLTDFDLQVYGPGWKSSGLPPSITHGEAFGARTNELFNRARINLNIHNWFGQGSAMNLRLFEVPAAGAFLLTDWVDEIAGAYVEGAHLACWRSVDELRARIGHYLERPDERHAIAAAGRAHFLQHHSYTARAGELLAHCGF